MARVVTPDGVRWRVGRRWLPWRRRTDGVEPLVDVGFPDVGGDDLGIGVVIALVVGAVLLLLVLVPLLLVIAELALLLLLLPVVALWRVVARRPWQVVARSRTGEVWTGSAVGWRGTGRLVAVAADGLARQGMPRGLQRQRD